MSKNYDMIATVDIDIATPIVDDTSFDNLLIMGPAPKTGAKSPARVGVYSDISEVEDAGFVTSGADADPVGLAASVLARRRCISLFSSSPKALLWPARPSRTPMLRSRSMRARKRALPAAPSPSRSLPAS